PASGAVPAIACPCRTVVRMAIRQGSPPLLWENIGRNADKDHPDVPGCQPPAASPPPISYRLSAIGYQLSAIGYQLSAIGYQLAAGAPRPRVAPDDSG